MAASQRKPLKEACIKIGSGATPRGGKEAYSGGATALIRSQNVYNDQFSYDGLAYIDDAQAEELANVVVCEGDVLLNITGDSVARCCRAPADVIPARVNQHVAIIRPDASLLHAGFLRYVLVSPEYQHHLLALASAGATRSALTKGMIDALEVPLPPLPEQKRIAHVLGTLDDKIELNRRMNTTLEGISRALFKSWFEPIAASALRASVGELTAAGVLEVGDGYRAKNEELGDIGLPFARVGNIDNGFTFREVDHLLPSSVAKAGEKLSRPFDVVFTSKGTVGRFAFVPPAMPRFVFSPQLCFWRSVDHARLNPHILFQWMQSRSFLDQVDRVKGQTDMAEYVSLRDQRRMEMSLPDSSAQAIVAPRLEHLQARIWANTAEMRSLAALRDALLPKLLSGEICVPEAEQAVEEGVG